MASSTSSRRLSWSGGRMHLSVTASESLPVKHLVWIVFAAGAFNLYDGTIQHKVLRIHQVREGVANEAPYDAVFLATAAAIAAVGGALTIAARRSGLPARHGRS